MCVQTQLQEQGDRITALESQNYSPGEVAAAKAQLDRIETFLFGSQRDKSNVVVKS